MDEIRDFFRRSLYLDQIDGRYRRETYPKVDISETRSHYILRAEVPGFRKEDLKIIYEDGILTLQGERKSAEAGRSLYSERYGDSFIRHFELPEGIRVRDIRANYRNGVLEIRIPKARKLMEKEIRIQ